MSQPKYHFPSLICSHHSHSLPLLTSVSEGSNEMTTHFPTQTGTPLQVKEEILKITLRQLAKTEALTGNQDI